MRIRKIVVGLSAVIAVAAIAACSSGTSNSSASPQIAVAADTATSAPTQSTVDHTTTVAPTTTRPPVVTTKTVPTTTKTVPTTTKAPVARTAAKVSSTPCSVAAKACVDLSARKAWLVDDGKIVYGPVSIMPGRVGWRTPVGTFHVEFKSAHYFSHEFQVPMPDAVFFYPGIAFHVGSLSVHSHGCVHLSRTSASKFFHTLSTGDEVQVVQ